MSKISVSSPAAGTATYTISAPAGSTDRTITLPDSNGTILTTATAGVPVNGPAFSAYANAGQTLTGNVTTKIGINTELFDTNSNYDTSVYRFTPTVAGYYALNLYVGIASSSTSYYCDVRLFKNGSPIAGQPITGGGGNGTSFFRGSASTVVYANGTTDYFEVYATTNITLATAECGFSGALIRSAT